eukprot:tig00021531_g22168.t1
MQACAAFCGASVPASVQQARQVPGCTGGSARPAAGTGRRPRSHVADGKRASALSWSASVAFVGKAEAHAQPALKCQPQRPATASQPAASASSSSSGGAVVTGSTKGIGLALARELLRNGVDVVITGRSQERVDAVVAMLQAEAGARGRAYGLAGDVSRYEDVERLAAFAKEKLGTLTYWINNAGANGYQLSPLTEFPPERIRDVVEANTLGLLYGCRAALRVMKDQGSGHVFNMVGAGTAGNPTPTYATYGATKRSIPQLTKSLVKESKGTGVGIHNLQPGMVLTDLLLSGTTPLQRRFFNVLAETPANVASDLVPKILAVSGTGGDVSFLTVPRILFRFSTFWARRGRFFDDEGNPVGDWVQDGEVRTSPLGVSRE